MNSRAIPNSRILSKIKNIALEAALEAGQIQAKNFRKKLKITEKKGAGLVTEVDIKSEKLIMKRLRKSFPSFAIIGEESGHTGDVAGDSPVWHIDPLDGTTNYAHGFPMYGVSIGLAIGNEPIVGVVHAPSLGETWHAAKGQGAFLGRKKLQVSARKHLRESLLATGFAYMKGAPLTIAVERFRKVSLESRAVRRPGAAALDLAYLAMGVYDGFWERELNSWDVCAGICLIREAKGLVTNFAGAPFEFNQGELLGSNGKIHDVIAKILNSTQDSPVNG